MKAILMSIHPKWCKLIFSGEKTIEVRKTAPKLETPFEVYVYQTKHKGKSIVSEALNTVYGGGKVIGSFVCDKVYAESIYFDKKHDVSWSFVFVDSACLTIDELNAYGDEKMLYGWHITSPKLFDKPRELGEFRTIKCTNKKGSCSDCKIKPDCIKYLTRPPQSWCYVEELQ